MVKRRERDELLVDAPVVQDDESGSDTEMDIVNVDFEWFNFRVDTDFHGTKNLFRQLFDVDSQIFDLSGLTDLVLSQPTIGSTVKVNGEESDAYAVITVLNLQQHREVQSVKKISRYLTEKCGINENLAPITSVLNSEASVGLILSERLINVPCEIAPPMYSMLIDEIEAAIEDKEPYNFSHYLLLSKTYNEIASTIDQEDNPRTKRKKNSVNTREIFYFHPEDEVLLKYATAFGNFEYTNDEGPGMADSKRAFSEMGIKANGALILIEANKFVEAVKAINDCFHPS
ncbi:unnamed protein product [Blumeria hordei]|uniref:Protein BCP1 n=1 Tax=Blumeria hordei TaxID=2867405 RepID=A0A383UNK5_BLUHO|nr:unnamed protein product [Blumeria hordei]